MEKDIAIKVENVGMTFRLVSNKTKSLKNFVIQKAKNKRRPRMGRRQIQLYPRNRYFCSGGVQPCFLE